jgi:phosphoglycerate dehydrogenase-like enzyme
VTGPEYAFIQKRKERMRMMARQTVGVIGLGNMARSKGSHINKGVYY